MIKDLIRSIMRENVAASDEDLMSDNTDTSVRDAFIGEDGEVDDTSDLTDAKIKDLIKNLPESNSNMTSDEISELSESYLDVFEDADYALESSVSIDSKIRKNERVIESLTYKDSLTEDEQQQLREAKKQLSVLTMVKESQGDDLDMETLEESNTIDITMEDTEELALEGKQGPDHPQSLNMRDKEDYERIKGEGGWNDKVKEKERMKAVEKRVHQRDKYRDLNKSYEDGPTRASGDDNYFLDEREKAGNRSWTGADRINADRSYMRHERRHNPDGDNAKNQKEVYARQAEERAKESFIIDGEEVFLEENYIDGEEVFLEENYLEEDDNMIFDVSEGYTPEEDFDDVMESSYEGEVTLALEGARMRYLEEMKKKEKSLKDEIEKMQNRANIATGTRKRDLDDKIEKKKEELAEVRKDAAYYATGSNNEHPVGASSRHAKNKVSGKYGHEDTRRETSRKGKSDFMKDFGGPERGEYDPPVSRYKQSGSGPQRESFIIDGEEVLFEENLYADDQPIHDRYNPKKDGSAGVSSKGKYADDEWINDVGVDESDELDLTDDFF